MSVETMENPMIDASIISNIELGSEGTISSQEIKEDEPHAKPIIGNAVRRPSHARRVSVSGSGLDYTEDDNRVTISLNKDNFWTNHILMRTIPKEAYNMTSFRGKLCRFCHDSKVQNCLNVLLICDLLIVISSIQVELHYKESMIENYKEACALGQEELIGDEHLEHVEHGLMMTSIAILICFLIEQILLMIGMGLEFFQKPMEVLDLFVVGISLYFELEAANFAAILLIISRTWRFIRIFHGMFTLDEDEEHDKEDKEGNGDEHAKKNEEMVESPAQLALKAQAALQAKATLEAEVEKK